MSYQRRCMTRQVEDKNSPLRYYLDRRFPNIPPIRAGYRAAAGSLRVQATGIAPNLSGTLGAAFDFLTRLTVAPAHRPAIAMRAAPIAREPRHLAVVEQLCAVAGLAARRPPRAEDFARAARACWALALTTALYRNPAVLEATPIADLMRRDEFTAEAMLAVAPPAAVDQLRALHETATPVLAEFLAAPTVVVAGPEFAASRLCPADGDLIVDGVLIEIKTRQGDRVPATGARRDSLEQRDIHQILSYVLFDTLDHYRLRSVALYSARYANLHRWPLQGFLDTLAGTPVDLATERDTVWTLLGGQRTPTGEPALHAPAPT